MIFGNGSKYDKETCENFDDGNHDELQEYVQKVSLPSKQPDVIKYFFFFTKYWLSLIVMLGGTG